MQEIPVFTSYDAYCLHVQLLLKAELEELIAGNKLGTKLLRDRVTEINKTTALLSRNLLIKQIQE